MKNPILDIVNKRKMGILCGIPSYCCANKLVIEAILEQAKRFDEIVLIEGTSNQVNQYRGYTGMTPGEFVDFVYQIADTIGFSREKILLGGDHLGPLPWMEKCSEEAMKEAEALVKDAVLAGYQKIHLDTSMPLGKEENLTDEVIAQRGARLYQICEQAYAERKKECPDAVHPVYVIGSEVPVPGGAQWDTNEVRVTKSEDFERTLQIYHHVFAELGLQGAWQHIVAVVVQPGVEEGSGAIRDYNRQEAANLCKTLQKYPDIVFEGHSTDYQMPEKLKEMVEDGIAIIKVGPALTFALREALFALSFMERELVEKEKERACFIETLERHMLSEPDKWNQYYHGTEQENRIDRRYSYSDRCRYFLADKEVDETIERLFRNIDSGKVPMGLLHQYMPAQYDRIRAGRLPLKAKELVKDHVVQLVENYNYAVNRNYVTWRKM